MINDHERRRWRVENKSAKDVSHESKKIMSVRINGHGVRLNTKCINNKPFDTDSRRQAPVTIHENDFSSCFRHHARNSIVLYRIGQYTAHLHGRYRSPEDGFN